MRLTDRKPPPVAEGAVLPMINVVFLLLVFFMLAGRLAEPDPAGIEPPPMSAGESYDGGRMTVAMAADGSLRLDGVPVAVERLGSAFVAGAHPPAVVVKADGAVKSGRLLAVLDALRAAGVTDISLVARAAE